MMSSNAPMRRLEGRDYILCVCVCVFVQSRRRKDEKTEAFPLYFFGLPNYENAALTLNNTPSAVYCRIHTARVCVSACLYYVFVMGRVHIV